MPGVHHKSYICAKDGFRLGTKAVNAKLETVNCIRARVSRAEVNAGKEILPAIEGMKYRMVDCIMIAIGGNAGGADGVQVKCDTNVLVDAKVAAIEKDDVARAGDDNVNVLDDGASFVTQDANKGITVIKDGSDLDTADHIDVILSYVIEE